MRRAQRAQTTWHVDDDCTPPGTGTQVDPFCTIQDGVNAASNGDTVLVAPGTYTGDGNRDISLFGKRITLRFAITYLIFQLCDPVVKRLNRLSDFFFGAPKFFFGSKDLSITGSSSCHV